MKAILKWTRRGVFKFSLLSVACATIFTSSIQFAVADDPVTVVEKKEAEARKERFTNWMRKFAEETQINTLGKTEPDDEKKRFAELVPNPVFRYSDEERLIPDATLWVWTRDSRPIAFQKVEGNNYGNGQAWTICFASLSEELISIKWSTGRKYATRLPGVTFKPIPDTDAPADSPRGRTSGCSGK